MSSVMDRLQNRREFATASGAVYTYVFSIVYYFFINTTTTSISVSNTTTNISTAAASITTSTGNHITVNF